MALSKVTQTIRQLDSGQNGYSEVSGIAQFSTTDASGDILCPLRVIEEVSITPIGPVATDETIYLDEAAQINTALPKLKIVRKAAKTLTVTRTGAAKTNGLMFAFRFRGYLLLLGILLAGLGGCSEYATVKDAATGATVYGPAPVVRDDAGVPHDARTGSTLPSVNPATGNATKTTTATRLDPDKVEATGGGVVQVAAAATPPPYSDAVKVVGGLAVGILVGLARKRFAGSNSPATVPPPPTP